MIICQWERPFHEYWAEFQRYTLETGYNIKVKISFITAELSIKLQCQIIYHDIFEIFNKYVTLWQTLNHKDHAMQNKICQPRGFTTLFQSGNIRASESAPSKSSISNISVTVTIFKPQ